MNNLVLIVLLLVFSANAVAQNKGVQLCQGAILGEKFISDGQNHQALLVSAKTTKFNVVFYPKFRYKIVVCSNHKQVSIDMKVTNANGTVYFSNADKDYTRQWEFQYSSIMNAMVELKLADPNIKEESIQLLIGYQPL